MGRRWAEAQNVPPTTDPCYKQNPKVNVSNGPMSTFIKTSVLHIPEEWPRLCSPSIRKQEKLPLATITMIGFSSSALRITKLYGAFYNSYLYSSSPKSLLHFHWMITKAEKLRRLPKLQVEDGTNENPDKPLVFWSDWPQSLDNACPQQYKCRCLGGWLTLTVGMCSSSVCTPPLPLPQLSRKLSPVSGTTGKRSL